MIVPVTNKSIEIFFDEPTHKYVDQFGNNYKSVTTVLKNIEKEFDSKYWAVKKAQETNKSVKQVTKEWDDIRDASLKKGTHEHFQIETSIKNVSIFNKMIETVNKDKGSRVFSITDVLTDPEGTNIDYDKFATNLPSQFAAILPAIKYYVDNGYRIYSEVNVFHSQYLISGTIDVLLVKGLDFVIIDWKTGRKPILFTSGYYAKDAAKQLTDKWVSKNEVLLYPVNNLPNCNGSIYTLQLSIYSLLVSAFGLTNRALILYHIQDHFILNCYGMPVVNKDGSYIVDASKGKNVKYYVIKYLANEAELIINNHVSKLKLKDTNQLKLM